MADGPGKYDDVCTMAREMAGVQSPGGAVLIIIGGDRGPGFECQCDALTLAYLPEMLEKIAGDIRADREAMSS